MKIPVRYRTGIFDVYQRIQCYHVAGKEIFANMHRKIYRILVNTIKIYLLVENIHLYYCNGGKDMVN